MKPQSTDRRRQRGFEFPRRKRMTIRDEAEYERILMRARLLHDTEGDHSTELEIIALAILEWELCRGAAET